MNVVASLLFAALVRLQDCVLSFHKHGMQGKSLLTSQVSGLQPLSIVLMYSKSICSLVA